MLLPVLSGQPVQFGAYRITLVSVAPLEKVGRYCHWSPQIRLQIGDKEIVTDKLGNWFTWQEYRDPHFGEPKPIVVKVHSRSKIELLLPDEFAQRIDPVLYREIMFPIEGLRLAKTG